jgi:hypothetical protein
MASDATTTQSAIGDSFTRWFYRISIQAFGIRAG